MEGFNHPSPQGGEPRLWAHHPLHFLHRNNGGRVDVVISHSGGRPGRTPLDSYIGKPGLLEWHHLVMPNILPMETKARTFSTQNLESLKYTPSPVHSLHGHHHNNEEAKAAPQDIQSALKWVPHPSCPINPVEALDLQERISEMKEAKAAHQEELRIYEAAVAIQLKVRQVQATLQYRTQIALSKTQASTISKESLRPEQSKQGKSYQSETSTSSEQSTIKVSEVYTKQGETKFDHEQSYAVPEEKDLSTAEPKVADNKIDDGGVSNVFAKQGKTKFDPGHSNGPYVKRGRTEKEITRSQSSTYFTREFKPEAGTAYSSKTKPGPEQLSVEFEKKLAKEGKSSILAKVSNCGSLEKEMDKTKSTGTTAEIKPKVDPATEEMIEPAITKITLSKQRGPSQTQTSSRSIQSGYKVNDHSNELFAKQSEPQLMAVSKTFNRTFNSNKHIKSQPNEVCRTFNNNKDIKSQPNEDPLTHATRVAQRDGPSDGHRGGGRNGGRGKFNRGGRGNPGARGNRRGTGVPYFQQGQGEPYSQQVPGVPYFQQGQGGPYSLQVPVGSPLMQGPVGAHGTVAVNRTSLDPPVNISCAKLLRYTAGAYPQVQPFQNSVGASSMKIQWVPSRR